MGSIFEAFVFCGDYEEAANFLEEKDEIFGFENSHLEVEVDMSVIYVYTSETLEPEIVENIAKEICLEFDKCLYVYWNDEENTSYSMLYDQENGFVDMFGEDDEIWVELDENANPNLKGQRYTRQETLDSQDAEKSYTCIFSSLDSALIHLKSDVTIKGQALIKLEEEDTDDEEEDDDYEEESRGFF
ncbi:MAG: hypothetical protein HY819_10390 [Acidobacteria bacterium]|nr:hypothetical protein [Acidobacteriota bacterium]